ncbi:MAG: hypothetical protein K0Q72_5145 [Armatimonadetes bacterium]|jgi:hypothetical protein|nr:hypothetical protein [Armatimonadota bacterium]
MRRTAAGLVAVGLLVSCTAAWAETALMNITPQNIKESTFRVKSKVSRNNTVEFAIRRDVKDVNQPSRSAYLSFGEKTIGTPVKVEQNGKIWTFRFSVPADKVADGMFTLWGAGRPAYGDGITYRFRLADFRQPGQD